MHRVERVAGCGSLSGTRLVFSRHSPSRPRSPPYTWPSCLVRRSRRRDCYTHGYTTGCAGARPSAAASAARTSRGAPAPPTSGLDRYRTGRRESSRELLRRQRRKFVVRNKRLPGRTILSPAVEAQQHEGCGACAAPCHSPTLDPDAPRLAVDAQRALRHVIVLRRGRRRGFRREPLAHGNRSVHMAGSRDSRRSRRVRRHEVVRGALGRGGTVFSGRQRFGGSVHGLRGCGDRSFQLHSPGLAVQAAPRGLHPPPGTGIFGSWTDPPSATPRRTATLASAMMWSSAGWERTGSCSIRLRSASTF